MTDLSTAESHRPFALELRVQFNETDAMGVVHHSRYVNYVERARVEYLRDRGLSYRALTDRGVHLGVVEIQFRYRAPARFDDVLSVQLELSELGRASASFTFEILRKGQRICDGVTKLACMTNQMKLRRIPDDVRSQLERRT